MNDIYTNLSLKKNNIDELFQNLSENPVQMPNKDFRLQLSTIYQVFEEEFNGAFVCRGLNPLRKTHIYPVAGKTLKFFVTPINNFDFYLKSKGSLYRFSPSKRVINGETVDGYEIPAEVIWEYFSGFEGVLNFEDGTDSFNYLNCFTQVIMKMVERFYFIPSVTVGEKLFKINWDLISDKPEIIKLLGAIESDMPQGLFAETANKSEHELFNDLFNNYFEYIIYKFLFIKAGKFKDSKTAFYFIKNTSFKRYERSVDVAIAVSEWLDEMHIGKYSIVPLIRVEKVSEDCFHLSIDIQNKVTKETLPITILNEEKEVFGIKPAIALRNIEKQLNYIFRYFPDMVLIFR